MSDRARRTRRPVSWDENEPEEEEADTSSSSRHRKRQGKKTPPQISSNPKQRRKRTRSATEESEESLSSAPDGPTKLRYVVRYTLEDAKLGMDIGEQVDDSEDEDGDYYRVVFPHLVEPLGLVLQNRQEKAVVVGFSRTIAARQGPAEQVGVIHKGDILCGINNCRFYSAITYHQKICMLRDAVGEITLHFWRRKSIQSPKKGFASYWTQMIQEALNTRADTPFQADSLTLTSPLDMSNVPESPLENQLRTARLGLSSSPTRASTTQVEALQWKEPRKISENMFVNQLCRVMTQYKCGAESICRKHGLNLHRMLQWLQREMFLEANDEIVLYTYSWLVSLSEHSGFGALVGGGHERIMDVLRNKGIIDKECSGHGISASQLEDEEHSDEEDAQLSNETRLLKSVRQTMLPLLQVKQCLKIDIPFAGLGWTHRIERNRFQKTMKQKHSRVGQRYSCAAIPGGYTLRRMNKRLQGESLSQTLDKCPAHILSSSPSSCVLDSKYREVLRSWEGDQAQHEKEIEEARVQEEILPSCRTLAHNGVSIGGICVWEPCQSLSHNELDNYLAKFPECQEELALNVLYTEDFNIESAEKMMEELKHATTLDNDWRTWTPKEMVAFETAIISHGKNFSAIAADVGSRSLAQCVQFYYAKWKSHPHYAMWKLRCHDGHDFHIDYHNESCNVCGSGGNLLCCDSCHLVFHLSCIGVSPSEVNFDAQWACPICVVLFEKLHYMERARELVKEEYSRIDNLKAHRISSRNLQLKLWSSQAKESHLSGGCLLLNSDEVIGPAHVATTRILNGDPRGANHQRLRRFLPQIVDGNSSCATYNSGSSSA